MFLTVLKPTTLVPPVWVPGECPGVEWQHYGEYCYLFKPDTYHTWENADMTCKQEAGSYASLTSIHSKEEDDYIRRQLVQLTIWPFPRDSWIGLTYDLQGKIMQTVFI